MAALFPFGVTTGIIYAIAAILLVVYLRRRVKTCPMCHQRGAFDWTGQMKPGIPFITYREEWKCSNCGHQEWKVRNPR